MRTGDRVRFQETAMDPFSCDKSNEVPYTFGTITGCLL